MCQVLGFLGFSTSVEPQGSKEGFLAACQGLQLMLEKAACGGYNFKLSMAMAGLVYCLIKFYWAFIPDLPTWR